MIVDDKGSKTLGRNTWRSGLNCIKGASGKVIVDDKGIKDT